MDLEIPKYDGENSPKPKTKTNLPPADSSPASGPEKTKDGDADETYAKVQKVKAIVCIATLSAAAASAAYAADLRLACASMVLALAKWLVANWSSAASAAVDRPKEVCSVGRDVEEQSRAIGLKKVQKARRNEPAERNLPREKRFWDPSSELGSSSV